MEKIKVEVIERALKRARIILDEQNNKSQKPEWFIKIKDTASIRIALYGKMVERLKDTPLNTLKQRGICPNDFQFSSNYIITNHGELPNLGGDSVSTLDLMTQQQELYLVHMLCTSPIISQDSSDPIALQKVCAQYNCPTDNIQTSPGVQNPESITPDTYWKIIEGALNVTEVPPQDIIQFCINVFNKINPDKRKKERRRKFWRNVFPIIVACIVVVLILGLGRKYGFKIGFQIDSIFDMLDIFDIIKDLLAGLLSGIVAERAATEHYTRNGHSFSDKRSILWLALTGGLSVAFLIFSIFLWMDPNLIYTGSKEGYFLWVFGFCVVEFVCTLATCLVIGFWPTKRREEEQQPAQQAEEK